MVDENGGGTWTGCESSLTAAPEGSEVLPRQKRSNADEVTVTGVSENELPPLRVLLVDAQVQARSQIVRCLQGMPVTLVQAASVAEARQKLAEGPVDMAMIEPDLPDGSGMALAGELATGRSRTQTIVMTERPSVERAIEAIRSGAADFIIKPFNMSDLGARLRQAMIRHRSGRNTRQRIDRLRRICRKLNEARDEVTQQVDVLCSDLVTAYQELASQVNHVAQTGEFAGMVKNELDLEKMIRKTLEYVLQKAGPTNAAIFLPTSGDGYTLGGYVNYDCTAESADILLQHLADVVAPKVAEHDGMVHITDNQTLAGWIGDDAAYLEDSHVLTFPCRHNQEALAIVTLFRDGGQPFDGELVQACAAIGPLLAEYLAKLIRIHHRSNAFSDEGDTVA